MVNKKVKAYSSAFVACKRESGYLPCTWEKPEIPVGKPNGLHYSVWEASENMGCDFQQGAQKCDLL